MKRLLPFTAAMLGAAIACAEDATLKDGSVLKEARVVSVSAGRVCIRHAAGLSQVERSQLTGELAAKYPASAEAVAEEDSRAQTDAERLREKQEAAALRRESAERSPAARRPVEAAPDLGAIEDCARRHAKGYFENEYRTGSGASTNYRVRVTVEPPEPISGWVDQWRVKGRATLAYYDSKGWGNYGRDGRAFEVVVVKRPNGGFAVDRFDLGR